MNKTDWVKGSLLYEGKGKRVYSVQSHDDLLWLEFKDQLTAFNAQKIGRFDSKGAINRQIASAIYGYLREHKVQTHWVADVGEHETIVRRLTMVPLEVVVRNWLAGSTAKKFGIEEGTTLSKPLVEFYYKKDELNDPFVSDDQALLLKAAANQKELDQLKSLALEVNRHLLEFFKAIDIDLIDFKLEFGKDQHSEMILGDEITPDSCRLWDHATKQKLDKDRFRRDLGGVEQGYQEVLNRIHRHWSQK